MCSQSFPAHGSRPDALGIHALGRVFQRVEGGRAGDGGQNAAEVNRDDAVVGGVVRLVDNHHADHVARVLK